MPEPRYAINRADEPLEGLDGDCWEFHMEVPPELVDALQGATPEQMQEFAYAAVCLMLGPESEIAMVESASGMGWWFAGQMGDHANGDTRAEALRALAQKVKGETK